MRSVNPATGEPLAEFEEHSPREVDKRLQRAHDAFVAWREVPFSGRAARVRRAAEILRARRDEYAQRMALEMGKPIRDGRQEIDKCAWCADHYADNAERYLAPEPATTDTERCKVVYQPMGVILAVMPWNFPFWQVLRFAFPSIMAGNAAALKHASNVPGCALAIEEVFAEVGFPAGLFTTLLVGSREVEGLIAHDRVRAVTLTGSTPAGRSVARKAGEMLKKTVLELGGSDAYVVLADADLEMAAELCVRSRLINTGQSCIAAKRFIVVEPIRSEFERLVVARMSEARVGDPMREDTDLGPLARPDLRDQLHEQVERSVERGARLLLGGTVPAGAGAWYPATVLTDVRPGVPAYDEELFGPVAAIIPVPDEDAAVHAANDTSFGLGAAVFTRDIGKGVDLATRRLEAGSCFVNTYVRSDPRFPFGGVKESGYGRELGIHGIREFVNVKTICVRSS